MTRKIHPYFVQNEFSLDEVIFPVTTIPRFEPSQVDFTTRITKRTVLKKPIIGSPMDTVTESEMAILLAKMGGIGVLHSGLSIERQLQEIEKVRRWKAGFILTPAVLGPEATVGDVLLGEYDLGFSSYPITEDGTLKTPIIGLVTGRDVQDYHGANQQQISVTRVMTPKEKLVFARVEDTLDKQDVRAADALIRKHGLDTLPILDKKGLVVALVSRSDINKDERYPQATKDDNHQLKVYAAVESRFQVAKERIAAIAKTGISGIVIDSRNIYGDYLAIAKFAKAQNPNLDIIIGNLVDPAVLKEVLEEAGKLIDAFRVGIGTGEVCITTEDLGIGRPMGSALLDLDQAFQKLNRNDKYGFIGFIPDGGIKAPRHFLAGAMLIKNFGGVMMGSVLAGFDESPGPKMQTKPGVYVKKVRGMGSDGAIAERAGSSRYGVDLVDPSKRYAEGIEKMVPAVGPGEPRIDKYFEGIRTAMHGLGAKNLKELYERATLHPASKAASKGTL